jgi:hypothetical protein
MTQNVCQTPEIDWSKSDLVYCGVRQHGGQVDGNHWSCAWVVVAAAGQPLSGSATAAVDYSIVLAIRHDDRRAIRR